MTRKGKGKGGMVSKGKGSKGMGMMRRWWLGRPYTNAKSKGKGSNGMGKGKNRTRGRRTVPPYPNTMQLLRGRAAKMY